MIPSSSSSRFTNRKKKKKEKKGHALHDQTVKLWLGCQLASNKSRWEKKKKKVPPLPPKGWIYNGWREIDYVYKYCAPLNNRLVRDRSKKKETLCVCCFFFFWGLVLFHVNNPNTNALGNEC